MWLLDTVALSETRKRSINPGFSAWLDAAPSGSLHTSVLCLGEVRRGIVLMPDGEVRDGLSRWLDVELCGWLGSAALPVDEAIAQRWGRLGRRGSDASIDALIGCTAAARGLTVVTRNVRHFDGLGVSVLNPWT